MEYDLTRSQGDGWKIRTKYGYIEFRCTDDANEIWWVESHKRGHGSQLVDLMQELFPATTILWGATSADGEALRQKWHRANPDVSGGEGKSYPHDGQFNPFEDGTEDYDDYDDLVEEYYV